MRTRTTVIRVAAGVLAAAVLLWAVDVAGNLNVLGTLTATVVDFTSATSTAPMKSGTTLPATCSVGHQFFKSDAVAGQNIYLCTAANTWTQVTGGGGAAYDQKFNTRYVSAFADFLGVPWGATSWYDGGLHFSRGAGTNSFSNPHGTAPDIPEMGFLAFGTTATAASYFKVYADFTTASAPVSGLYNVSNLPWEFKVRFRYPSATDYAASTLYLAMTYNANASGSLPLQGLGLRYDTAAPDTSFTFYTSQSNGTLASSYATGVAPDTNFHVLKVRSDGTLTNKVWISLDGGTEIDICPSGCTLTASSTLGPTMRSFQTHLLTNEAVQKIFQLDYVSFWLDRGTAR